jgi:hypothetical protein
MSPEPGRLLSGKGNLSYLVLLLVLVIGRENRIDHEQEHEHDYDEDGALYQPRAERHVALTLVSGESVPVPRVPIDLARHIHDDGEQNEKRDRSHEESVVLLSQRDVEEGVNAQQPAADH